MDHYIDIKLLPDPEFSAPVLMNALFAKLHRGLVEHGGYDIGVSFPDVGTAGITLGKRLRLHGSFASLDRLIRIGWIQGMRGHIDLTPARPVPADAGHRVVCRVQAKSSPERLRRRLMARKGIGEKEAREAIPDSAARRLRLPYVELASHTTGQRFRLFIEHRPIQPSPAQGQGLFSTYGLSATATVPWF
ncbi:type I-F CRISPR-associated endoribonuclease Cas6/Csy4 [Pseudothauera nasutitermitis]|uniref:Type I-F CRISPR-associated endoribonuclease Cas6/Csy4 n=1 Tax=Pseudothauera nasutitermitis TaxID=2565930 RepID=A0A4S4ASV6_9RHOO|nr:type I-F CRISPR-associated endoribonuclease Cas6/Csy4 [Pseudothauera nasutitermitis]THF62840.1 type I-F CRISPR-associated endoribonuclease Cas6/Csy4 [Pseudothauera nasutitermitis]